MDDEQQLTKEELTALRGLIERYFDIKEEYGWYRWGRIFYERLYVVAAKLDEALATGTGLGLPAIDNDELTYVDLRYLINMIQSEEILNWSVTDLYREKFSYIHSETLTDRTFWSNIKLKLEERLRQSGKGLI